MTAIIGPPPQAEELPPLLAVLAAGEAIHAAGAAVAAAQGCWGALPTPEVAGAFGAVMRLRALAEGAAADMVLEAWRRGVIAESGHADVTQWVRIQSEQAGAPITPNAAVAFATLTRVAEWGKDASEGPGTWGADPALAGPASALTDAVTAGIVSTQVAARLSKDLTIIAARVPQPVAGTAMNALIACAARGDSPRELTFAREAVIANYGEEGTFDEEQKIAFEQREMTPWRRDELGRHVATIKLDADCHAILHAALNALSAPNPMCHGQELYERARHDHEPLGDELDVESAGIGVGGIGVGGASERDERTASQRRADALIDLARVVGTDPALLSDHVRPGSASKAQVLVTMNLDDLRARTGCGVDAFGAPLSPAQVRRQSCDAQIIPAVLGADSAPLDLGRAVRTVTAAQHAYLRLRDRGCTFPGCDRPPSWCEAHHLIHWVDGGATSIDNMALLCGRHHTIVHQRHYAGRLHDGRITWCKKAPPDAPCP
ncbi:MAG: DUF222 domain-containing protein [Dermatophilaceae bacterium]